MYVWMCWEWYVALVAESADEPQCFVSEFVRAYERRKLVVERGKQIIEVVECLGSYSRC